MCLIQRVPREWPAVHQAICELRRPSAQGCQNSPASLPFIANSPPKIYTYFLVLMCVWVCAKCVSWGRFLGQYGVLRSVGGCQRPAADTVRGTILAATRLMVCHGKTIRNRLGVIFNHFKGANGQILQITRCLPLL